MIEKEFVHRLKAATVAQAANRVFPDIVPPTKKLPAVTYFSKHTVQLGRTLRGAGGLPKQVFQVDLWAEHKDDVKAMEDAVRTTFDPDDENAGASGDWPSDDGESVFVQGTEVQENTDDFAPPLVAQEFGIRCVSLNVAVVYVQP